MNKVIRDSVSTAISAALVRLKASNQLDLDALPEIRVDATKDSKFGDVASNIALVLASQVKQPAPLIGEKIVAELSSSKNAHGVFRSVELAGPGFINFFLGDEPLRSVLADILSSDLDYGRSSLGKGKRVLIEFVSANPTGPLTLAHGRQAGVGDSLARIMKFCGYDVTSEYYLNDRGRQIETLGRSVLLRYRGLYGDKVEFPQDFYQGDYIGDLANEVREREHDRFMKEDEKDAVAFFSKYACDRIMGDIKKDLCDFGVSFDHFFSEKKLVAEGKVEACLEELKGKGVVYDKEGALWLRSTALGDDKDRVLIKSSGEMTYISPDIAYHKEKWVRGYDWVVNIWGPDHHGYVPRLKAALSALGYDPGRLKVIILQLATLYEGKEKIQMSTRRGEYVTLREIMNEVGKDVGRYFFLMRHTDSHLDFDLELAKKHSLENPVYYIQYAHARICSIFEKYFKEYVKGSPIDVHSLALLKNFEPGEVELVKKLGLFQEILEVCSNSLDPYGLTDYLLKVAQAFHQFYTQHRIISEDSEKTQGRLALVKGVQIVLRNGLDLLGINAPKSM